MEKKVPHCELTVIQGLVAKGEIRATFTATLSAEGLGCDFDGMAQVVVALTPADFYKSMTTCIDDAVWQDVYRPVTKYGDLYLKLTVIDDVLIVSFKEL